MKKTVRLIAIGLFIVVATYLGVADKYIKQILSNVGEKQEEVVGENDTSISSNQNIIIGKVTHVSDGDTVTLTDENGNKKKIRLDGIDAPEIGQEFGEESKDFVKNIALHKNVRIEVIGIDQYKRVLGVLYVNNTNVNEELLVNGLAWQYYHNKNVRYSELVEVAKKKKLNIWSKPNSIDPYYWRKENKK